MGNEVSKTGVYVDTKTGKVVEKQPEEGIQLVAPGNEITPAVQEDIDRYKAVEKGEPAEVGTVTTATVKRSKS